MGRSTERRASPRCDAVPNQSRIELPLSQGGERAEARLVNISRHGALVVTETPPPDATQVWLRTETPVKTDWVEATIVRRSKNQEVGLEFPRGCPDDLLLAATIGIDLRSMFVGGPTHTPSFD